MPNRYFVFLDESCSPRDRHRFYIIASLLCSENEVNLLNDIQDKVLDHIRSARGLNIQELRGADLYRKLRDKGLHGKFANIMDYVSAELSRIKSLMTIVIAIDKQEYNKVVINAIIDGVLRVLKEHSSPYANTLTLEYVKAKILSSIRDSIKATLLMSQIMNEVLYCTNKLLNTLGAQGYLVFDSDAKTIQESLYSFLGRAFTIEGVATAKGIEPVNTIRLILLGDSKLMPGLQFADIIAYTTHRMLEYNEIKVFKPFIKLLNRVTYVTKGRIWGYSLKVIPWSDSEGEKLVSKIKQS